MRRAFHILLKYAVGLAAGFVLLAGDVHAQPPDVGRATREGDRFQKEAIEKKMQRVPRKPPVLEEMEKPVVSKEEKKFFIKKVILLGCESVPAEHFATIIKKYEGKDLTMTELNILAREIEREYLRKGIIAAVFLPPQDIVDQTVTLRVVEAKMGELIIQKHKYYSGDRLRNYWKIHPGDVLSYGEMSKDLQMMNKNPDREVKAALKAGTEPGTTDVVITPITKFPLHGLYSFDNEGAISTGKWRTTFGVRDNNTLGMDDIFMGGYNFGKDFWGMYGYHNLPLNYSGTSLIYGYNYSLSLPKKDYEPFGMKSETSGASATLHQDLYWKDEYVGEVFTGFEAKDKRVTTIAQGTLNKDRFRIVSFGANLLRRTEAGSVSFSPEFSQGLNAFGASSPTNPLASRLASSTFSKFNIALQTRTPLPFGLQQNLKVKTQFASEKLTPQEEFPLGGIDSVRGYPYADYNADNAWLTNFEILIPAFLIPSSWRLPYDKNTLKDNVTPLVFMDYGYGTRRDERKPHNLTSIGAGLRFNIYDQAILRLEWGYRIGDTPMSEGAGKEGGRFHIAIDFQDKLPEETERIKLEMEEEYVKRVSWELVDQELAKPESPLRQKMERYRQEAEEASLKGDLKRSREIYARIYQLSQQLYKQAEVYVRDCIAQKKELKEQSDLALERYKDGRKREAKQLWQKIASDAKPKPLVFTF